MSNVKGWGRITPLQVYMFFSQFLFASIIGFFVSPLLRNAQYMAWLSVILGAAFALVIGYLSYRLSMKRPNRLFWQYGQEIVGKWIHRAVSLAVVLMTLFAGAFLLRQLTDFMVQIYLPDTPSWAIAVMFGICLARGVRSGITTIFRSAQGVFFFSIITVAVFPLFATQEFRADMTIALITNVNLSGTWNGAMMVAAIFGEIAFIAYFFGYFAHQPRIKKSLFWAVLTATLVILSDVIATILLFGPELGANFTYPILELIRYVRTGAFLENLDPLLLVFWLYSMFLKISFFLLTSVTGLTYSLGLNDHKPFTYTMTAFAVGLSLFMFESTATSEEITRHGESTFVFLVDLVPAFYLLVDWLRSMGRKKAQDQSAQAPPVNGHGS